MQLTIEIPDEQASRLKVEADRQGLSVERLLAARLASETVPTPNSEFLKLSPKERAERFVAWAKSHRDTPALPFDALSRESMYSDR